MARQVYDYMAPVWCEDCKARKYGQVAYGADLESEDDALEAIEYPDEDNDEVEYYSVSDGKKSEGKMLMMNLHDN